MFELLKRRNKTPDFTPDKIFTNVIQNKDINNSKPLQMLRIDNVKSNP